MTLRKVFKLVPHECELHEIKKGDVFTMSGRPTDWPPGDDWAAQTHVIVASSDGKLLNDRPDEPMHAEVIGYTFVRDEKASPWDNEEPKNG